jgi:hypothetical protein
MAATDILLIANTNMIWIEGLKNDVTAAFVNDATCSIVEVLDSADAVVSGSANILMTYKTASDGRYYGALPYTVTLTENDEYTVHVLAIDGTGQRADWRRTVRARYRNQ